jgi:S-adenosylmethionine synthetase
VRTMADHFSGPDGFRASHPWCGSDVKVMAHSVGAELDMVLAVPQKCVHVASRTVYLGNNDAVLGLLAESCGFGSGVAA